MSSDNKTNLNREEAVKDVPGTVKVIVADHLGIDKEVITEDSSFIEDLGADSLDTIEAVMLFEDTFGVEISDAQAEQITTVGDAITFIQEQVKS